MKPSFSIVGCGRVGTALGRHLSKAGYRLHGLSCKTEASVKKAANLLGTDNYTLDSLKITSGADIVFITTPDGVISQVCEDISGKRGFNANSIVLHCSGAHPSTILSSAKKCGAFIGSMHPLQSFAAEGSKNTFKSIIISVEGDTAAIAAAKAMASDLESVCLTIKTEAKTLYHGAAVVASNYLVAVQDLAIKFIEIAGIESKDAFKVLSPLIQGTLLNIEAVGTTKALTGPIARGDLETVARHIDGINKESPDLLYLYSALGRHTVDIALRGGTISVEKAQALKKILLS